jgi:hypothetical protein
LAFLVRFTDLAAERLVASWIVHGEVLRFLRDDGHDGSQASGIEKLTTPYQQ